MQHLKEFFQDIGNSIRRAFRQALAAARRAFGTANKEEDPERELFPEEDTLTRRVRPVHIRDENGETRLFDREEERALIEAADADERHVENEPLFTDRPRKRPFVLSVLFTTIRFMAVGIVLAGFAGLGAGIGIAKAYVETAPTLDRAQLTKSDRTSYLYDMNGKLITTIADVEYRDWVDIDQIPELLQNAFISIEDVRFYKHSGVDIKRLFSVALEVLGNNNAAGGSTITQQLIKNKILGSERTYKRKIQEAYLALELEKEISKKDILEAYLNDIHLGESNYGVKTAAKDYFGKELDQLTVRECAMLAGLTQNPYYYNPRKNKYKRDPVYWTYTNDRTDTVLGRMYEAGLITLEQYREALSEDVNIIEVSQQTQMYDMPYFVEYAIRDVVTHLLAQRGLTDADRSAVENELRTGGYHIYTTVDPDIQHTVQDTLSTWDKYPGLADPSKNVVVETNADGSVIETVEPQASAVVFDYHTGELRAVIGGRESPTIRKGFNRAYQSYMEVGSSIKPIAVYGPALDAGASPATVVANVPAEIQGWGGERGYPAIGSTKYIGPVTIREGIVNSLNVVAGRVLYDLVWPEVSAEYLSRLGANMSKINVDGPGLALGTSGFTTIQMAAAYGAIADGGEYKEPLSFTRVVDSNGNVILDANQIRDTHRVFKPSTAYLLVDMMTDAVQHGTGTKAKISGMTVAGKTGTNSDYASVYFAGMTPYYTAAVWVGHDNPVNVLKGKASGGDYAAPLWQSFMAKIHEGLPNKSIMDVSPNELGLVKKTVCSVSGKLATDACRQDTDNPPVTDWFLEEDVPTEFCDMHAAVSICTESGQIATSNCPETTVVSGSKVLIRPGTYYDLLSDEELKAAIPNAVRTSLSVEEYQENLYSSRDLCTLHSTAGQSLPQLRLQALELRQDILKCLSEATLSPDDVHALTEQTEALRAASTSTSTQSIAYAILQAQQELARVQDGGSHDATSSPEDTEGGA
ncbi:MAG: PBP1A family penicillin-binding protein [Bacillota bacterium]